jgi:hypothetical protein
MRDRARSLEVVTLLWASIAPDRVLKNDLGRLTSGHGFIPRRQVEATCTHLLSLAGEAGRVGGKLNSYP